MNTESNTHALLLKVGWLSILLGIGMECLLLLASAGFHAFPAARAVIADFAQKIAWSYFVCVGLAFGAVSSKRSIPAMGFSGLVSAPGAFYLAKGLHKGLLEALSVSGPAAGIPGAFQLASIKAAEYACLGMLVGWIGKQAWGNGKMHAITGLALGLVFGGFIIYLTLQGAAKPPAPAVLVSKGINEVLFPVGCSLVLYAAGALARKRV